MRALIRLLFDFWVKWLHASKVTHVTWTGFDRPLQAGVVYVANHPSLIDATCLLAKLPDALCIFKPKLMHNPAIGPAAKMAGYVAGVNPTDILRLASDGVSNGQSLLIFPEGTRTKPGSTLEPLKHGFALVAQRSRSPVQLILIRTSEGLVPRGRPWWKPPKQLPGEIEIKLDEYWAYQPDRTPIQLASAVEQRLHDALKPFLNPPRPSDD